MILQETNKKAYKLIASIRKSIDFFLMSRLHQTKKQAFTIVHYSVYVPVSNTLQNPLRNSIKKTIDVKLTEYEFTNNL